MLTWAVHAVRWETRLLNVSTVQHWLVDGVDLPTSTWRRKPEHQSDMIGLALLRRYGGVWLDASIALTQPLEWVPRLLAERGGKVDSLW